MRTLKIEDLKVLWNGYAKNYEAPYKSRLHREHLNQLVSLFLPGSEIVLDAGCGTGILIPYIVERIRAKEIWLLDWSSAMLEEAKAKAKKWQSCIFKFYCEDLCNLRNTFPEESVDAIICNLVINYLPCGWREAINQFKKLLKPGGYLYLGTLLKEWKFDISFLLRHGFGDIIRDPLTSLKELQYLKHQKIISKITKVAIQHGASFPSRDQLLEHLSTENFAEIETRTTYWGYGIALRARKTL